MSTLLKYYKHRIPHLIAAFLLLFVQAQCDLALPDYMSRIVANGIAVSDTGYIWKTGALMLLVSLLGVASAIGVSYVAARLGGALAKDLRISIFSKVSSFSSTEFNRFSTSSLITRSTNDVTQILMFTVMMVRTVFYAPIMGIGGVVKCISLGQNMPLVTTVIAVAVGAVIAGIIFLLVVVQPKFAIVQKMVDRTNLVARESLSGMMVIRAFNTQRYEENRFDQVNSDLTGINLFVSRTLALMMPILTIIMNGVSLAIVWVAAISAQDVTDAANMLAFLQYAVQIIMSFMFVSLMLILMPRALISANRIGEILNCEIAVTDRPDAKDAGRLRGEIVFEDVSFRFPGGQDNALTHVSFTAKPGQTTAFIGSTGSGKSALVRLIPRLYDVTEGRITVDGTDLRDLTLESLRRNIGFVPQKNVLFSGTIASNIAYGIPEEEQSEEQVIRAAEAAQATEFIDSRPDGYDTEIAQGGANVSGGQKQRLAIARALAKNCPIYIFDDSFSALDFKTDAALRRALKTQTADAAVLIVAQRVGTIMNADQIIVLDEGKVVGIGTHRELLKTCGIYADIAKSQLSEEELR